MLRSIRPFAASCRRQKHIASDGGACWVPVACNPACSDRERAHAPKLSIVQLAWLDLSRQVT